MSGSASRVTNTLHAIQRSDVVGHFAPSGPALAPTIAPDDSADYEALVRQQLVLLGENPNREGLLKTPERVAKSMQLLTRGYRCRARGRRRRRHLRGGAREHGDGARHRALLVCASTTCCRSSARRTSRTSRTGKIVGLSKLPRIVDMFARRLQVQERLTEQIANAIEESSAPEGRRRRRSRRPTCA